MKRIRSGLAAALVAAGLVAGVALAQGGAESTIRKNLAQRLPNIGAIDEVTRTPLPGLFEVRIGTDLYYSDAEGNYLIQGQILDTRAKRNLTEDRMEKLLAVDFKTLPLKDAITIVHGNGKRKIAVFEDPNCGYCKRFEREVPKLENVTMYVFLYPILGPDSTEKSRNIWCAADRAKAWTNWMQRDQVPAKAECDTSALARNLEFGQKHKITGTPTMLFTDGKRVPGALPIAQIEKLLAQAK